MPIEKQKFTYKFDEILYFDHHFGNTFSVKIAKKKQTFAFLFETIALMTLTTKTTTTTTLGITALMSGSLFCVLNVWFFFYFYFL